MSAEQPAASTCTCGHSADWHSHDGAGDCEYDGECECQGFVSGPCPSCGQTCCAEGECCYGEGCRTSSAATASWQLSWRADPVARAVADRHYNRQAVGAAQFVPPGACVVLRTTEGGAAWITSWPIAEYVQHAWPGAWINSLFRNERRDLYLSSDLIREAVAVTLSEWPEPPALGMVTFVDASKTRRKRDPGRCYRRAGFRHVGFTQGGLWAFQMLPDEMPEPVVPGGKQLECVA